MGQSKKPVHLSSGLMEVLTAINNNYLDLERQNIFPDDGWKNLCRYGLAAGCLPKELNGADLSFTRYAKNLQELGYYSRDNGLNFALMAHALACVWPLYLHGKTGQIQKLLPLFASGEKILTNAMTEEGAGSDVYRMQTIAVKHKEGYVLSGKKSFCTNAPVASHALLYAATNAQKGFFGGISVFLVDLNAKGVKVGPNFEKMGLRTAAASTIELENVLVANDFLVAGEGAGGMIFQESMVLEKIYMAASHTGTLERWLDDMHQFAGKRKTGGNSLLKKQSVLHRLAEIRVQLEAAKALVKEAVLRLETGNISACIQYAAMVKYFVSNTMTSAAQQYLNMYGGRGYLAENGIEVQVRDFMAAAIYSGTSEIQKNMIATGQWR